MKYKVDVKFCLAVLLLLWLFGSNLTFAQEKYPFHNTKLSMEQRVDDLIGRLTLDEKAGFLWELTPGVERLGIDKFYVGNEALHGVVRPGKFTVFPQAIAFGATFNPKLIHQVSTAISDEARGRWNELNYGKEQKQWHSDLLVFFSPTINMARDPRWGRTAETYGEDPYLTSRIGVSFVKGLQGDDPNYLKVVATPKHYIANNVEENRFGANSIISERTLREYYLPAFKACIVEGKAYSIMSAYNAVNYVPSNANRWLLKDVLRREWGFDGYVVSDCGGPCHLTVTHKLTPTYADAAAAAIRSGMDLECNGGCNIIRDHIGKAIELGKIQEEEVDYALSNVLKARFKLGMFDPLEAVAYNSIGPKIVGSEKHKELALETARQSIVLLKNENNILPIKPKKNKSIAIVGHNANEIIYGDYSGVSFNDPISPYEGIKTMVGDDVKINFVETEIRMHDLTMIPTRYLKTVDGKAGLSAEYFNNRELEGAGQKRVDLQVDLHSKDNPPDPFMPEGAKSVRWEGYLTQQVSGTYDLGVSSDDGCRLWIDDELIIDGWKDQGETLYEVKKSFEKDKKYKIKLEWYDGGGGFACRLLWKIPGGRGLSFNKEVAASKKSDLVIAVLGTGLYNEAEGRDKAHLDLPGDQLEMLKAVHKVNKNIVVILVTGSQHTIPWIKENIPAVINAWYPGEQGGNAIAEVLFGKYNPAGRLPLTYYENVETLPDLERYEINEGRTYMYYRGKPLWEFGYGLSYSTFKYSDLTLNKTRLSENGELKVALNVKNTGKYDGDEVIQLYLSYPDSKLNRPGKQLRRFKRVSIPKGKSKEILFTLSKEDLMYWSVKRQDWGVEIGTAQLSIGASSNDIRLKQTFEVE